MYGTGKDRISGKRARRAAALLALLLLLSLASACVKPDPGEDVIDIPGSPTNYGGSTSAPENSPDATDEAVPTPTPAPDSAEARILSGQTLPLNGLAPLDLSFEGASVDIDGDGAPERISVEDIDGGATLCIDGEAFMDGGLIAAIASPEGKNMVFLAAKPGEEGYRAFYPDEGGNLFCRLFGIVRQGSIPGFAQKGSYEELIRGGMDIMLHNPMIYSEADGLTRTVRLDMDGDGQAEEIVFDSALLTVNGQPNTKILSTTMPRFTFDAEHGAIVIYGSAGDYALRLRLENGVLVEDISYATLL